MLSVNSPIQLHNDNQTNNKSNAEYYKSYLNSFDYYNVASNPIYYAVKGDQPAPNTANTSKSSAFEELDALINSNKFHKIETKKLQTQKQNGKNITATVLMKKDMLTPSMRSTSMTNLEKNYIPKNSKLDNLPELKLKNSHKSIENLLQEKPPSPTTKLTNNNEEFQTSLYIGPDFGPEDISVQLVDNFQGYKITKKLLVHCLKIEPIQSNSLTINTSKLATPTIIDLDLTKGNNCLKRELKKDIILPENCDINTLESYLENCYLFIKCLCLKTVYTSVKVVKPRDHVFQNPLYNENGRSILKSSVESEEAERQNRRKQTCRNVKRPKSNDGFLNDQKSVRFEVEEKPRSKSRSIERHLSSNHRLIDEDVLEDGFNCVTRDAMDNIFLTYFFKLPTCSPSDRTQVRIENKNILKLKIIQETNLSVKKSFKKNKEMSSSSSSAILSSSESDLESIDSDSSDDKLMLREFSRQCKLPDNFFKFDESGVSVSFVNNGWVRIEIPIVEFFDFNCALNSKPAKCTKKKLHHHHHHREYHQKSKSENYNEVRV